MNSYGGPPGPNRAVQVQCNGVPGYFMLEEQLVKCCCNACEAAGLTAQWDVLISPTEFERHAGLGATRKWRHSIKVVDDATAAAADGKPPLSIGRWLDQQAAEQAMIGRAPPKSSAPLPSSRSERSARAANAQAAAAAAAAASNTSPQAPSNRSSAGAAAGGWSQRGPQQAGYADRWGGAGAPGPSSSQRQSIPALAPHTNSPHRVAAATGTPSPPPQRLPPPSQQQLQQQHWQMQARQSPASGYPPQGIRAPPPPPLYQHQHQQPVRVVQPALPRTIAGKERPGGFRPLAVSLPSPSPVPDGEALIGDEEEEHAKSLLIMHDSLPDQTAKQEHLPCSPKLEPDPEGPGQSTAEKAGKVSKGDAAARAGPGAAAGQHAGGLAQPLTQRKARTWLVCPVAGKQPHEIEQLKASRIGPHYQAEVAADPLGDKEELKQGELPGTAGKPGPDEEAALASAAGPEKAAAEALPRGAIDDDVEEAPSKAAGTQSDFQRRSRRGRGTGSSLRDESQGGGDDASLADTAGGGGGRKGGEPSPRNGMRSGSPSGGGALKRSRTTAGHSPFRPPLPRPPHHNQPVVTSWANPDRSKMTITVVLQGTTFVGTLHAQQHVLAMPVSPEAQAVGSQPRTSSPEARPRRSASYHEDLAERAVPPRVQDPYPASAAQARPWRHSPSSSGYGQGAMAAAASAAAAAAAMLQRSKAKIYFERGMPAFLIPGSQQGQAEYQAGGEPPRKAYSTVSAGGGGGAVAGGAGPEAMECDEFDLVEGGGRDSRPPSTCTLPTAFPVFAFVGGPGGAIFPLEALQPADLMAAGEPLEEHPYSGNAEARGREGRHQGGPAQGRARSPSPSSSWGPDSGAESEGEEQPHHRSRGHAHHQQQHHHQQQQYQAGGHVGARRADFHPGASMQAHVPQQQQQQQQQLQASAPPSAFRRVGGTGAGPSGLGAGAAGAAAGGAGGNHPQGSQGGPARSGGLPETSWLASEDLEIDDHEGADMILSLLGQGTAAAGSTGGAGQQYNSSSQRRGASAGGAADGYAAGRQQSQGGQQGQQAQAPRRPQPQLHQPAAQVPSQAQTQAQLQAIWPGLDEAATSQLAAWERQAFSAGGTVAAAPIAAAPLAWGQLPPGTVLVQRQPQQASYHNTAGELAQVGLVSLLGPTAQPGMGTPGSTGGTQRRISKGTDKTAVNLSQPRHTVYVTHRKPQEGAPAPGKQEHHTSPPGGSGARAGGAGGAPGGQLRRTSRSIAPPPPAWDAHGEYGSDPDQPPAKQARRPPNHHQQGQRNASTTPKGAAGREASAARADEGTEDEAALFGGTAGHGGRVGRCAVCVVQRKGKCGTDSAPRKCLRRQMLAQMHGEGGDVEGSDGEGVGRGGGPPEGSPPLGSRRGPANQYPGQFGR